MAVLTPQTGKMLADGRIANRAAWVLASLMLCLLLASQHVYEQEKAELRAALETEHRSEEKLRERQTMEAEGAFSDLATVHEPFFDLGQMEAHKFSMSEAPYPSVERRLQPHEGQCNCTDTWRIIGDGCEASSNLNDSDCIVTTNYPSYFPRSNRASVGCSIEITANPDFWIAIEDYEVKINFDYVVINNHQYRYDSPPQIFRPDGGSFVMWRPSGAHYDGYKSVEEIWNPPQRGWRMCRRSTCEHYACPLGYVAKPSPEFLVCASAVCDAEDTATCCEKACEAPENLDEAVYDMNSSCTAGRTYTVSECPVSCASGHVLDGNHPPQKCLDNGTFALPSCIASDTAAFPWVLHGQCQQYGPSCASSLGVGGRYGAAESCLITIDHTDLPLKASNYQMLVTYVDTVQNNLDADNNDRLILGVELEPTSCDNAEWTCQSTNESDIPTYGWSTSMKTVSGASSPQGPYSLGNILWTSDSSTMGTGWVVCVQMGCIAMSCPSGYRFNCKSEGSWCTSHDCSLSADVDICCLRESEEDENIDGYIAGEAHNISWCWAATTSTTTWVARPDIVGHFVLTLSNFAGGDSSAAEEALRQMVHSGLMSLGQVGQWDVQVGLNMTDDVEPISHVAFRVEQTNVQLDLLSNDDFISAFNNGTDSVRAITHRALKSTIAPLRGDPSAETRAFGSGCENLHPCSELSSWPNCWQEESSGMTCSYINDKDVCGPGMTPGPGWHAHWGASPNFTYEHWATVLAVSGTESVTDECCACGGGRCSNGFFRIFNDVPTFCIPCQAGTTSVSADDPRECTPCEPGYFAGTEAAPYCSACSPGRYNDNYGAAECSVCPPGTISTGEGRTACEGCPQGTAPSADKTECILCAPGTFAGSNATAECELCPAGQFNGQVGMSECDLCEVGFFTGSPGRADCDTCSPGSFAGVRGLSACQSCQTGRAQALAQQTACEECEPGYSARVEGLSACLLCDPGTETTTAGASECTQCEAGFIKPAGNLSCFACGAGTYASEQGRTACSFCPLLGQHTNRPEGATGCEDCLPGRYAAVLGLTSCIECAMGFFGMEEKMTACEQCNEGRFAGEIGLTECLLCKPGSFAPIKGQQTCDNCAPGEEAPAPGSIECSICDAGTYSDAPGTPTCKDCVKGYFTPLPGQTACQSCQPGRYAAENASQECQLCSAGSFAEAEGLTRCTACWEVRPGPPEFWTTMRPPSEEDEARSSGIKEWISLRGASSNTSCGCRPGTQPRNGACEECGEGLICLGMGVLEIEPGYAWDGEHSTWDCKLGVEDACPGGMPGVCMPGRDPTSIGCAICLPGMLGTKDGSCVDCEGGDYALPIVMSLVMVALGFAAYLRFDRPSGKRPILSILLIIVSLGQAITIVQQVGIISLIDVRWSGPLLSVMEFLRTIAFINLQDIRAGCIADMDILQQYTTRVVIVFIAMLLVCMAHGLSQLIQHRQEWRTRWHSLWCALGTILLACMVSIVSTMIGPMQCRGHPNGKHTVSFYPSIICWEGGDHSKMVAIGSVACLLPVGFLVASSWAVWQYPKKLMNAEMRFLRSWSFFFFRYSPEAYWYGPVVMVRNCLIATAPVLTSAVLQIATLQVFMLASLVFLLYVTPYRLSRANDLDAIGHLCLLGITMLAAFFTSEEDLGFISNLAVVVICFIPFAVLIVLGYGLFMAVLSRRRQYQFFLCHHKSGAGCFCRLLKMWLLKTSGVKRKVFIDSDNLQNLDHLFDVVAHETETLVAMNSQNLLTRPWCVGEITTAHKNHVRIMPIYVAGVDPPSKDFITNFLTYVPAVSSIMNLGIDIDTIIEALQWFAQANRSALPQEVTDATLGALCQGLVSVKLPEQLPMDRTHSQMSAEVVIISNGMDFEAAATAMILRNMFNPLTRKQDQGLSYVLGLSENVHRNVKKGMLICTNGVFTEHVLGALLTCKASSVAVLPIMSVTNFIFPSAEWMDTQKAFAQAPEARRVVPAVFTEIAIDFQPSALSGTEVALRTKAEEISNRVAGVMISLSKKVSELEKRESHMSGMTQLRTSSMDSSQRHGSTQLVNTSSMPTQRGSVATTLVSQAIELIDPDWEIGADLGPA